MRTLLYLSIPSFADTDITILPGLTKNFRVSYAMIITNRESNFSMLEIEQFCNAHNILFIPLFVIRRQRDPRIVFEYAKMFKIANAFKTDLIYSFCFDHPLLSICSYRLDNRRTVIFIHDVKFHSSSRYLGISRLGRKITINRFQYFQVFSNSQATIFRQLYPKKIVYVIKQYLKNFERFTANANINDVKGENVRFLFFGRVLPYKGLKTLIHAINKLAMKYSNFELVIAGLCDDWEKSYEPLITNKDVINKMIGKIANKDIPNLFRSCHYLILPYKDATQSGPLLIAYNYYLPVIASNIEAFRENIRDSYNGFLFDYKDISQLVKLLEDAVSRSMSDYILLRQNVKEFVENNISLEIILRDYDRMFEEISDNLSKVL